MCLNVNVIFMFTVFMFYDLVTTHMASYKTKLKQMYISHGTDYEKNRIITEMHHTTINHTIPPSTTTHHHQPHHHHQPQHTTFITHTTTINHNTPPSSLTPPPEKQQPAMTPSFTFFLSLCRVVSCSRTCARQVTSVPPPPSSTPASSSSCSSTFTLVASSTVTSSPKTSSSIAMETLRSQTLALLRSSPTGTNCFSYFSFLPPCLLFSAFVARSSLLPLFTLSQFNFFKLFDYYNCLFISHHPTPPRPPTFYPSNLTTTILPQPPTGRGRCVALLSTWHPRSSKTRATTGLLTGGPLESSSSKCSAGGCALRVH